MNDVDNKIIESILSEIKGTERICDIGCGNNFLLQGLIKAYPDAKYLGIDNDPSVIIDLNETIIMNNYSSNAIAILGSYNKIPSHMKFEISVCSRLFHHLDNIKARELLLIMLNSIQRDGLLLIIDSIRFFHDRKDRYFYTPFYFINEICNINQVDTKIIHKEDFEMSVGTYWILKAKINAKYNTFELQVI
jgi:cyclopropane fatty-acyl-phospholipid synthase-like methyltransferase